MILYTYLVYPLLIYLLAKLRKEKNIPSQDYTPAPYSILMAVYNEEKNINRRIENLLHLDTNEIFHEIIIVSDGSTDNTVNITRILQNKYPLIKLIVLNENIGKAAALNYAINQAKGEVIIFADARQEFSKDAITNLIRGFSAENVGCVSGHLVFKSSDSSNDTSQSIGAYWKYETFIRINEAKYDSVIGCPGAIYAVKKHLITAMPAGLILDDLWIPMGVVLQGSKVKYVQTAVAWDRPENTVEKEFRRKVRTLTGNFQLVFFLPKVLSPFHNRLWWMFLSHKIFRLLVPYAMLAALFSNVVIYSHGAIYKAILFMQVIAYISALIGYVQVKHALKLKCKPCNIIYLFVNINLAAALGLYYFLAAKENVLWKK